MSSSSTVLLAVIVPLTVLSITVALWTLRVNRRKVEALEARVAPWGSHVMRNVGPRKAHETLAWLARVEELLAVPAPDVGTR